MGMAFQGWRRPRKLSDFSLDFGGILVVGFDNDGLRLSTSCFLLWTCPSLVIRQCTFRYFRGVALGGRSGVFYFQNLALLLLGSPKSPALPLLVTVKTKRRITDQFVIAD